MLFVAGCAPLGRADFAAPTVAPSAAEIADTHAFAGRVPFVTIQPGTTNFDGPVAAAVRQALAIKPDASFEVAAEAPAGAPPDKTAAAFSSLAPLAADVQATIIHAGVSPERVMLAAQTSEGSPEVVIYVK